jgi:L-threonylcarbamoyladenylate synthase
MQTQILPIKRSSLRLAKKILKSSGVVAFPTETVYGLAGIGTDSIAVEKIFLTKGRPQDNPLICHVHKKYDIRKLVKVNKAYVYDLMKAFTPGPITFVFESTGVISEKAVCGGDTLAIRMPSHKGAQELLKAVDMPIVAPSANLSKHTSPVTAEHVYADLNGKIPLILDGGKCTGGIESTVLDVTSSRPRILRAGLVTKEMIEEVVGYCEIAEHKEGDKVKSPGVKYKHYRPKCETLLFKENEIKEIKKAYQEEVVRGGKPYIMCSSTFANNFEGFNLLQLGLSGEEIASNLYDELLEGEKVATLIIGVEMPSEDGVFMGIMNRLRKSCG